VPRSRALGVHTLWNDDRVVPVREAIRRAASDELRALLDRGPAPSDWIDEALQLEMHHRVFEALALRERGARIEYLEQLLFQRYQTMYRTQGLASHVRTLMQRFAAIWQSGHDTGELRVVDASATSATIELRHPFVPDEVYRDIAAAGGVALARLAGLQDPRCETRHVGGEERVVYTLHWTRARPSLKP